MTTSNLSLWYILKAHSHSGSISLPSVFSYSFYDALRSSPTPPVRWSVACTSCRYYFDIHWLFHLWLSLSSGLHFIPVVLPFPINIFLLCCLFSPQATPPLEVKFLFFDPFHFVITNGIWNLYVVCFISLISHFIFAIFAFVFWRFSTSVVTFIVPFNCLQFLFALIHFSCSFHVISRLFYGGWHFLTTFTALIQSVFNRHIVFIVAFQAFRRSSTSALRRLFISAVYR